MKRLHYVVFLALLAIGFAGSLLLVPGRAELGLLYFKARKNSEAQSVLEQRLRSGQRSIDVVIPLAELYVQSGDVDHALALLEHFPAGPGQQIALAETIGQFERYGQLTEQYLHTLEQINRMKSSAAILRQLAGLYRYYNQVGPLVGALQELASRYDPSSDELMELANLEAVGGQFARAASTLEELENRYPEAIGGATVEFLMSVLLDAGEGGRALERARRWLAQHPVPDEAVRLAGVLDSRGKPALGLKLLEPWAATIDTNPALLAEWVGLQTNAGASGTVFERLNGLYAAKRLSYEMKETLVNLALDRRDVELAIRVAEEQGFDRLPDRLLANLAEAALAGNREDLVRRVGASLRPTFLQTKPFLAARLALARGDRGDAENWLRQAAADPHLADADRLMIAENYLQFGRSREAFAQVSEVRLENLSPAEVLEAARVYENLGKSGEAVSRFAVFRPRGTEAAAGWALLAASSGRGREVAAWLESLPEAAISEDVLKDLYYAASDNKDFPLAIVCARRFYQRRPTDANRLLLATALTNGGQPAEALPHLRALLARPAQTDAPLSTLEVLEETYTAALRAAATQSGPAAASQLHAELRDFWTARLKGPAIDEKRRLDLIYGLLEIQAWNEALPPLADLARRHPELAPLYIDSAVKAGRKQDAVVFLEAELDRTGLAASDREPLLYALIEHGGYEVSLPYIRQLAVGSQGPWVAAYEDALRKLNRSSELAEFWKSRAELPGASAEERRSLAFNLLDAGHKEWALPIFRDLARTAKPDSAEVADLLFLWGPKPGADAAAWLEQRARESIGPERAAWWNHLLEIGAADRVAAMGPESLPPAGEGGVRLRVYLRALAELGERRRFAETVARELPQLQGPDQVRALARLIRDSGFDSAAETAYTRLWTLEPRDPEALHWLGLYAYSRANYSVAEERLGVLLRVTEGAYNDNFYYAEILWRKGDHSAARIYYARALRVIEQIADPPADARVEHAESLARCGFLERSLKEFRTLVAASPGDQNLRADFAALLIQNERYGETRRVLSAAGSSGGSRLVELRAQLLAATAQKKEALDLLGDFTDVHPDAASALESLALLDEGVMRNRQAQALLVQAAGLEPSNEDFRHALMDLEQQQEPQSETTFTRRTIQGGQGEDLIRIAANQVLGGAFHLHVEYDQDAASVNSVTSANGVAGPFRGVLRRGEATVQYETESGLRVEGAAYASDAGPGAGTAVTIPDARGTSIVRLDLNRPYWEFTQSLAGDGTRSRVELDREIVLSPGLSASLTAALNRYSLRQVSDAASSVSAQGRVTYSLLRHPQLSLEYNLDTEHALSVATREAADGLEFHPLPLVNREVHSAGVTVAGQPLRNVQASATAGYAVDRFGGRAPFLSASLNYKNRGRFGGGIDFDRRLYFFNTAQTVTTFGGHLSFRF
jgi:cellulose synthase operon protein C